jgi:uncharacterized spore protein YtfJ
MRRLGILVGFCAIVLLGFGTLGGEAQQGKGKGKGGGMFGGGFGKMDAATLINRADVKKELELSEEQSEKVPGVILKAITSVLNDKQAKRFREIELQARGNDAFVKDTELRKELKITDSQTKDIDTILEDSKKELAEVFKDAQGGNFKELGTKTEAIRKEAKEKVMGVLTADQKKQYKQMVGEEFKFEKGGFGKKKNDTN